MPGEGDRPGSLLDELLTFTPRGIRYIVAGLVVVTGCVVGAVFNTTAGGTVCAVLASIGCLSLIRMAVVDFGWTEKAQAARHAERMERLSDDFPEDSFEAREGKREAL